MDVWVAPEARNRSVAGNMDKKRNVEGEVRVTKSGIKELLGRIKSLELEVEAKNKQLREYAAEKELERDVFAKRIQALEEEIKISKKAFERIDESMEKKHQTDVKKLETELTVKGKITELVSAEMKGLKKRVAVQEAEKRQLQSELDKMRAQKNGDEITKKELGKYKQNLSKLQAKHQKATMELSKYNSLPVFAEILVTKELLSKLQVKLTKTKVNRNYMEEKRNNLLVYKEHVDNAKAANAKLLEAIDPKFVVNNTGESVHSMEWEISNIHLKVNDDIVNKLKKIYDVALLTVDLSEKFNKGIPVIVKDIASLTQKCDNELNALAGNSMQQSFVNLEKKYKNILQKLDDQKILFEALIRNFPEEKNALKAAKVTGRAEDLLKSKEAGASCSTAEDSSAAVTEMSLSNLKEQCDALFAKYYSGEGLDGSNKKSESPKRNTPTGWNFDLLESKSKGDNFTN